MLFSSKRKLTTDKSNKWMDLKNIKLNKRSQTQRRHKYDSIYVKFKDWQNKSTVIKIAIIVACVWARQ